MEEDVTDYLDEQVESREIVVAQTRSVEITDWGVYENKHVFLNKYDSTYIFYVSSPDRQTFEIFNQILSTFQFIDPMDNQDGEVDYGFECPDSKILDCSPCTKSPCPMYFPMYCSKGSPQYNWILKNCPDVTIIGLE